ncbi:MAG: hypothetical protein GSR86_07390 [Desulfurococcales archaeon]|nr:hypothetical protein [Desulfurococcales archaeon]
MSVDRDKFESLIRRTLDRLSELERLMWEEIIDTMGEVEELFNDRYTRLSQGVTEPLYTIIDKGDHIMVVIDVPGSIENTIQVDITEETIGIRAKLSEDLMRRAMHGIEWASRIRMYSGVIRLPMRVDPSTATIERRGTTLIIRVKKATES